MSLLEIDNDKLSYIKEQVKRVILTNVAGFSLV